MMGSKSEYLRFLEIGQKPKTKVWAVIAALSGGELGLIKWNGPWRKYSFFPHENTVYEWDCLRSIADFVEEVTYEHKASKDKK